MKRPSHHRAEKLDKFIAKLEDRAEAYGRMGEFVTTTPEQYAVSKILKEEVELIVKEMKSYFELEEGNVKR